MSKSNSKTEPVIIKEEQGFEQAMIGAVGNTSFMQLSHNDRVSAAQ
jgi:hypothetical protein